MARLSRSAKIMLVGVAAVVLLAAALIGQAWYRAHQGALIAQDQFQLRNLSFCFGEYLSEHGRYPSASGWVESLRPYAPELSVWDTDPTSRWAMNPRMSEKPVSEISRPDSTVVLHERAGPVHIRSVALFADGSIQLISIERLREAQGQSVTTGTE